MIMVGSQRSGPRALAAHLMNKEDNDHVTLFELRGFMSDSLVGALDEIDAAARGTRCKQFLFSLSINPPKEKQVGIDALVDAVNRAEDALDLLGQPRAIVVHEKDGRRHAHVVWSRIDAATMTAVNMSHFKYKLNDISRDLYLDHNWDLPKGYDEPDKRKSTNFSLAEWQQAKRVGLDPREIKQFFREAWEASDNQTSFKNALEERGYFLAKGDRRGFVAVDMNGEVFSVARTVGVKTKELNEKLGRPDSLPDVSGVRTQIRDRTAKQLREYLAKDQRAKDAEMAPLKAKQKAVVAAHGVEREKLAKAQRLRQQQEALVRSARFRRGLGGVMDSLTGKSREIRKRNEAEAWQGALRDRKQREDLFFAQNKERQTLQKPIDEMAARHRQQRMRLNSQILDALKSAPALGRDRARPRRDKDRGFDLVRERRSP